MYSKFYYNYLAILQQDWILISK